MFSTSRTIVPEKVARSCKEADNVTETEVTEVSKPVTHEGLTQFFFALENKNLTLDLTRCILLTL